MSETSVKTVVVDLALPVDDVITDGAASLHVTVLYQGRPLGVLELASPISLYPHELLARQATSAFGYQYVDARIDDVLSPPMTTPEPSISATVVVCTRNRPEQLARCLESLAGLEPQATHGVLIVDNGDGTSRIAAEARGFRWIHEVVPGLDRARNRALAETDSEVVLFCDDDVEVHPDWATKLTSCFDDPLVGAAGGLVLPSRLDTRAQQLTEQHASFQRGYVRRVFDGTRQSPLQAGRVGAGASLAVRRALLCELGGFPEELDGGTATRSGGDTFGVYRVLRAGFRAVYQPEALSFHRHRDAAGEPATTLEGYSTGTYAYFTTAAMGGDLAAAKLLLTWTWSWHIKRTLRSIIRRPGALSRRLAAAELKGAITAPSRIVEARRTTARRPCIDFEGLPQIPAETPTLSGPPVDDSVIPVSVVIPSRSRRDLVTALVESIDRQRPRCSEIVVVVDGDTDDTAHALRSLAIITPLVVVVHDENLGAAAARNRGAAEAKFDVLLFLDDDTVAARHDLVLQHWRAHEAADDSIAVVGGFEPVVDDDRELTLAIRNWWFDHVAHLGSASVLSATDVLTGNLSIRRSLFDRLGGFALLPRREDWEFGHRLEAAGVRIRSAPSAKVVLRVGVSVARSLRDRHLEAMGDVESAQLHPGMAHQLPLAQYHDLGRRRHLARVAFAFPTEVQRVVMAAAPLLETLSRYRLQRPFRRGYTLAVFLAYWSGVAAASGGEQAFVDSLLTRRRATFGIDDDAADYSLDDVDRQSPLWTASRVHVKLRGQTVASVPRHFGGYPWNDRNFVERLRHEVRPVLARAVTSPNLEAP